MNKVDNSVGDKHVYLNFVFTKIGLFGMILVSLGISRYVNNKGAFKYYVSAFEGEWGV